MTTSRLTTTHAKKLEFQRILRHTRLLGFVIGKDPDCPSGSGLYGLDIDTWLAASYR